MALTVPPYIEVKSKDGVLTAYLSPKADKLKECFINNRLNEECTLDFLLPLSSRKWQELTAECKIIAGTREFVILKPDAVDIQRDNQGRLWGKVMAVESWRLLDKDFVTVSNDPQTPDPPDLAVIILSGGDPAGGYPAGSAGSALTYLLQGSGWELDVCDVTGTHDLETEKISRLANVKEVQRIWGGYFVWDSINKKVSLRAEDTWQNYNGFQVRYAKNLKHIIRTDNYDLVTVLYPFGENDLDISSVNEGDKYLENYSYTNKVYVGVFRDQGIHDPQDLKDKGIEVLEKISKPRYTYRTGLADVRTLPEYSHEDFQIGDLADVIDEELGFNVKPRIVRHRYNVFMPWQCDLDIGEPEERLAANLKESFDVSKYIKSVVKPNEGFSNILKGVIDTYSTIVLGASGQYEMEDGVSTWKDADTGRWVVISPGGILITQNAGVTWDTAITGLGIAGQLIIAESIHGGSIRSDTTITAGSGNNVGVLDGADATYRIYAGHAVPASAPFRVNQQGQLVATDATITGTIQSSSILGGTIAIGSSNNIFKADSNGIYLGHATFASAPFRVNMQGQLVASNADITGTINATSGTFSGNLDAAGGTFSGTLATDTILMGLTSSSETRIAMRSEWGNAIIDSFEGFGGSTHLRMGYASTPTGIVVASSLFNVEVYGNLGVEIELEVGSNIRGYGNLRISNQIRSDTSFDIGTNTVIDSSLRVHASQVRIDGLTLSADASDRLVWNGRRVTQSYFTGGSCHVDAGSSSIVIRDLDGNTLGTITYD